MKLNYIVLLIILTLTGINVFAGDREVKDDSYKFSFTIPDTWDQRDVKETADKDAISYSFERKDKKAAVMLLAFKITAVKNLDDFIYVMEKDVDINIPKRQNDYTTFDKQFYDGKVAKYSDNNTTEYIYFVRTKLADAPFNYAYMFRFISNEQLMDAELDGELKKIGDSFTPTLKLN